MRAIKRDDRNARGFVYPAGHVGTGIGRSPEAVLRSKYFDHVHTQGKKGVEKMHTAHPGRMIDHQPYALVTDHGQI